MKDNYIDSFLAQEFGKSQNYNEIKNGLFSEFNVKKGLRNEDGTGVRVGLTKVSDVVGYDIIDGVKTNVDGKLYYRGYSLNDLVDGSAKSTRGYEEVMFLLLFGFYQIKWNLIISQRYSEVCIHCQATFLRVCFLEIPERI